METETSAPETETEYLVKRLFYMCERESNSVSLSLEKGEGKQHQSFGGGNRLWDGNRVALGKQEAVEAWLVCEEEVAKNRVTVRQRITVGVHCHRW